MTPAPTERASFARWFAVSLGLVLLVSIGLRFGTRVLERESVRDEALMRVPIDAILQQGWSIETAIDYQEVKGPAFFWSYALPASVIGGEMNQLRLLSIAFFIGGAIPLLLIAGRGGIRGRDLLLTAALYALLPYNAFLGQLLFSEPSFNFYALWLMWVFVWAIDQPAGSVGRGVGYVGFTVLLSVLLHHRPQAVAFAGAATFVAWSRDGVRSWPWWAACAVAGLSRLPLYVRWGGFVTSEYQGIFGLGSRPENLAYLLAVLLPVLAIFLWPALAERARRRHAGWLLAGAGAGLLLGLLATPDLAGRLEYVRPSTGDAAAQMQFAGVVATTLRQVSSHGVVQAGLLALLAAAGGASLAALLVSVRAWTVTDPRGVVGRLAFWTIALGAPLYALTTGPVYDRYIAIWIVLMPAVWVGRLPRPAIAVQGIALAAILTILVQRYLM